MRSLSSIVKARSLSIYSNDETNSVARIQSNVKPFTESDKSGKLVLEQTIRRSRHIYDEALKRANSVMEHARMESQSILDEARQQGYEEGYAQGRLDGAAEARTAAEEGLQEMADLIATIRNERMEAAERQKKELLQVAFEVAKKIMRQQILADENTVLNMLEEVLSEHETGVTIFLPEYSKTLDVTIDKGVAEKIRNACKNAKVVMTQKDDLIMAERENGMVDMSIPVQLSQLQKAVGLD